MSRYVVNTDLKTDEYVLFDTVRNVELKRYPLGSFSNAVIVASFMNKAL